MRAFDRAIVKLTAIYSGILLAVCLVFSVAIYSNASSNFGRRVISRPPDVQFEIGVDIGIEIEDWVRLRDEEIKRQMLMGLVMLNVYVLVGGVFLSYWLARITLRPIDENMREQEQFVANASHELRTPLNVMRVENEVLRRDKGAVMADYVQVVDSNLEEIDKLSRLCDRLLSLSHNEKIEVGEVDVQEVVRDARERVAPMLKKGMRIVEKVEPVKMNANREALTEVIEILLDNAIKYSPAKSTIRVANSGQKILVSDEGVGIAEEDLPHIFERFYRAEKSHTTNGHGLGLSLAQHLAGQQNLKIMVQNNPKKGATFIVG